MMFIGDRWESAEDTPIVEDIPKIKHTPRLDEDGVGNLVMFHIIEDLVPKQTEGKWPEGALDNIQGYDCL